MKLTDIVSPEDFLAASCGNRGDWPKQKKLVMEQTKPYEDALLEAGFLVDHSALDMANVMSTLCVLQYALNCQKVSA